MDRFWAKVTRKGADECWPWTASKHEKGYGRLWLHGKLVQAHRLAWELVNGPFPSGKIARHTCDNPGCVNPAHIVPGTAKQNTADSIERGRFRKVTPKKPQTHCNRGHEFTAENTKWKKTGTKSCRTCSRERDRQRNRNRTR